MGEVKGWKPLFDRLKREHSEETVHEGVPDHMWPSVLRWLMDAIIDRGPYGRRPVPSVEKLQDLELACRINLTWSSGPERAFESLQERMQADAELALEVVNRALYWTGNENLTQHDRRHILRLAQIFRDGGSAWRVGVNEDGYACLQRRLSDEVLTRYERTTSSTTRAAEHLRTGWDAMYGRDPDPTEAYEQAVKAVEAAAQPVLAPEDENATLTKMTAQLRDAKHKWAVEMAAGADHTTGVDVLHAMMDALGKGQHTRHGKPDRSQPKDHTSSEAEAAVHVALTLVHWLEAGLVQPTD